MTQAPAPQLSQQGYDRSLVRGLAWTGVSRWSIQILSWGSTLIIARLLSPEDYGLMSMALVYIGLVKLVNEMGLSAAIIQRRDLTSFQCARLGGVSLIAGVVFATFSLALSGAVSAFFGEPQVQPIVAVVGITFVSGSFQVLPKAMMSRELRFRGLALVDVIEALTSITVTLGLALAGFRYWSLVFGTVAASVAASGTALVLRPHRISWPRDIRSISSALTFGGHVVISRIGWYIYNNADFAVVGRVLGTAALGGYSFGWTLATIPVNRVSALLTRVTPAVFAAVQEDAAAVRRYLLGLTEGLAFVTFPAAVGLSLIADDLVAVALGPKWEPAIMPLRLLSLYAGFRSVSTLFPTVLVATGHAKKSMRYNLLAAVVLPIAFLIGSRWGTTGVAMAWIVVGPLLIVPTFVRSTLRLIRTPVAAYLAALRPASVATLVMAVCVGATRALWPSTEGHALRLAAQIGVGALVYAAVVFGAFRERLSRFKRLVQQARKPDGARA